MRLTSQFPSTTSAHVTTIHSGLPVGEHGVYEWFVYEPALDRLIAPLLFSYAGDARRETLRGRGLSPQDVFPAQTFYERLGGHGLASHVVQPAPLVASSASTALLAGATVVGHEQLAVGAREVAARVASSASAYGHLYVGALDALMHLEGPVSANVASLRDSILATLETQLLDVLPAGTLVLLTSDHGMVPISPERTTYVNVVWPDLATLVRRGADGKPLAPAGSPRDLFLHVGERRDDVIEELQARLGGRALVVATATLTEDGLFGPVIADALRRRLGDVAVLPADGEAVYWYERGRFEQRWRGMHGGLSKAEMEIPLVAFVT